MRRNLSTNRTGLIFCVTAFLVSALIECLFILLITKQLPLNLMALGFFLLTQGGIGLFTATVALKVAEHFSRQ